MTAGAFNLRDHVLLADGRRGAVIDPNGDIVWLCVPRWHDPALFSTMLGGSGHYAITPRERFTWGGHYDPGSLVWRSRWVTASNAIVESRDALARPAAAGGAVVLRRVLGRQGRTAVHVQLELSGGWSRTRAEDLRQQDDGSWTAQVDDLPVRWVGADAARRSGPAGLELELELAAGDVHDFVLVMGGHGGELPEAEALWSATESAWREDVPELSGTGSAARDSRLACAVMRGLTTPGGGMVAAATTALPEHADRGRDWDYRYVWMRDQCYAGQAAGKAGAWSLLDDAVGVVTARLLEHGPDLAPAYTVDGTRSPSPLTSGSPDTRAAPTRSATRSATSSSRRVRGGAAAVRRGGEPRPARRRRSPCRRDSRPRRGGSLEPPRRRGLGDRRPAVGPQQADLRRRPRGDGCTPARSRAVRRVAGARRHADRGGCRGLHARVRPLAARTG